MEVKGVTDDDIATSHQGARKVHCFCAFFLNRQNWSPYTHFPQSMCVQMSWSVRESSEYEVLCITGATQRPY